jgi:hypothetical protein
MPRALVAIGLCRIIDFGNIILIYVGVKTNVTIIASKFIHAIFIIGAFNVKIFTTTTWAFPRPLC